MNQLICYKTLPVWNKQTLPTSFMQQHNTKAGVWAKLTLFRGNLTFALLEPNGELIKQDVYSVTEQPPVVPPQDWHRIVNCSDDLQCQLAFYCQPEDYYHFKYDLTPPHSELIDASRLFNGGRALDVGCGRGRNSLYLNQHGFNVTACDINPMSLDQLRQIIASEQLSGIDVVTTDLNQANFKNDYDWVISTVVMMFLQPQAIPALIKQMQDCTKAGGYNLIVSAMQTDDFPSPIAFPFLFSSDELRNYYADWQIIKYNEDIGALHKTDANGNRIKLRFATLLARKITH